MTGPRSGSGFALGLFLMAALGCTSTPRLPDREVLCCRLLAHESPPQTESGRYLVGWIEVSRNDTNEVLQAIPVELNDPLFLS